MIQRSKKKQKTGRKKRKLLLLLSFPALPCFTSTSCCPVTVVYVRAFLLLCAREGTSTTYVRHRAPTTHCTGGGDNNCSSSSSFVFLPFSLAHSSSSSLLSVNFAIGFDSSALLDSSTVISNWDFVWTVRTVYVRCHAPGFKVIQPLSAVNPSLQKNTVCRLGASCCGSRYEQYGKLPHIYLNTHINFLFKNAVYV